MLVSDLKQSLEGVNERSLETTLGQIRLDGDARTLTVGTNDSALPTSQYQFDEQTERSLSKYLGVSKSYLAKCPPDLKAHNINYWLARRENAAAVVESIGDKFINIHKPGLIILPLQRVADVITTTFDPANEVVNLTRDDRRFHVDIKTDHHVEVATDERIEDRRQGDRAVGDITHGGVRLLANPTEVEAPKVLTYLHRLWCTNGSTSAIKEGTISLKGQTVDEVLDELNKAANDVMGNLDTALAEYAALATRTPPGSPTRFAYQLGMEAKLPQNVMNRVMERINILPDDASLYDIQQVFTQLANSQIPYKTMLRLQELGGEMAFQTDHVVHRCATCERLLPE